MATIKTARDVRDMIENMSPGTLFSEANVHGTSTNSKSIRRLLQRMCSEGEIHRAVRGIYYKPLGPGIFGEEDIPLVRDVATAIAQSRGWYIVPTGNTALNALGLSTQEPGHTQYVSTGPNAEYRYFDIAIEFKHTQCLRDLDGMSPMTQLVVQALKSLRSYRVSDQVLEQIAGRLTTRQIMEAVRETTIATEWVRNAIRRLPAIKERQTVRKGTENGTE